MKIFAVSDIHGQYDKFVTAIKEAGFNEKNKDHKLIICGDLFDRGNQNLELYQYIQSLLANQLDNLIVLRGNHELFFDHIIDRNTKSIGFNIEHNGFGKTLMAFTNLEMESIFNQIEDLKEIIDDRHPKLLNWIANLPYYYETYHYVFTHAGLDYRIENWHDSNWPKQVWNNLSDFQHVNLKDHGFHKKLVMGHFYTGRLTHQRSHNIYFHQDNQKIFIDGGAAMGDAGQINVLVIDDEDVID